MELPKLLVFKDKKSYFIDIFGKRYELIFPIEDIKKVVNTKKK